MVKAHASAIQLRLLPAQVVLEDRSMGRQVFCYACITRWLEVSSAGFTRAPHFYQTPFAADCCR